MLTIETLYSVDPDAKAEEDWLPLEFMIGELEPPVDETSLLRQSTERKSTSLGKILGIVCLSIIGFFIFLAILGGLVNSPTPSSSSNSGTAMQGPERLMLEAESSLRSGRFSQAAELLNRVLYEHPDSRQATTVRKLCSFVRGPDKSSDGPMTAPEAQTVRALLDSFDKIKGGYRTATPQTRRDLELVFGAETFHENDSGLDALSASGAKFQDSMEKARKGE